MTERKAMTVPVQTAEPADEQAMRKDFEMSQEQLDRLLAAMKPVAYMIFGGMGPRSQQENANDAWAALGKELGFEPMSVQPNGKGARFFSAEVRE